MATLLTGAFTTAAGVGLLASPQTQIALLISAGTFLTTTLAKNLHSRRCEYQADAFAQSHTSIKDVKSALSNIHLRTAEIPTITEHNIDPFVQEYEQNSGHCYDAIETLCPHPREMNRFKALDALNIS